MPIGLALAAALLPSLVGQETPSIPLGRLPQGVERPVVDGLLDEEAWAHATLIDELIQVEPVAGVPLSQRTEVRLLQDGQSIFLSVFCRDSDPDGIRATQMLRDVRLNPDDSVEFFFDTFLDRRNAFWFQVGPAGAKGDALITKNGSSFNKDFDTIWYTKTRITAEGWISEIEVPSASLNFDPEGDTWGFNIRRQIRRHNEDGRWASPDPRHGFFSIAQGGTLTGVGPLEQGLGLDVVPFAVGDWSTERTLDDTDFQTDAGFDAFYRITPNAKLSLSVNTDFAETEVDQRVVNLTRFPVFFPEKRDFFLEDSGAFFFGPSSGGPGGGSQDVVPFFSRRIGLDSDGQKVPLLGAVKLTGSTDSYSYGLLDVKTEETKTVRDQNFVVGRFSKNILEQSDVGIIATGGDPDGGNRDSTVGVDLNLRTDGFLDGQNLRISSYVVGTQQKGVSDQNLAYHTSVNYPNDEVNLSAEYTVVERNFDPALGFVRRSDMKKYESRLRYEPRLYNSIRQLEFSISPEVITDAGNSTESVQIFARPLGIEWESGEKLRFDLRHTREVLDEDFEIQTDVTIPKGSYTYDRFGGSFETSTKRDVSGEVSMFGGDFFDGERIDTEFEIDWRPSKHTIFGADYEINSVDLAGGDFRVRTASARADFLFTPEISWSNFVQYDNISDDLGLNSRLRWILAPGREINIVLNQSWVYKPPHVESLTTEVIAKISLTLRL